MGEGRTLLAHERERLREELVGVRVIVRLAALDAFARKVGNFDFVSVAKHRRLESGLYVAEHFFAGHRRSRGACCGGEHVDRQEDRKTGYAKGIHVGLHSGWP
jgi:hypothetical protein